MPSKPVAKWRENDLFTYISTTAIDLEYYEDPFSPVDCYSEERNVDIELKCRRTHYAGLEIEKKKYDAMMSHASTTGRDPWYVCSTPEGVFGWNLNQIEEPVWAEKPRPATTDFNRTKKVMKAVGELDTRTAHTRTV